MRQYLTTSEVAKRLDVGRDTVIRLIYRGILQAEKMPGRTGAYLIDPADVAQLERRPAPDQLVAAS